MGEADTVERKFQSVEARNHRRNSSGSSISNSSNSSISNHSGFYFHNSSLSFSCCISYFLLSHSSSFFSTGRNIRKKGRRKIKLASYLSFEEIKKVERICFSVYTLFFLCLFLPSLNAPFFSSLPPFLPSFIGFLSVSFLFPFSFVISFVSFPLFSLFSSCLPLPSSFLSLRPCFSHFPFSSALVFPLFLASPSFFLGFH